MPRKLLQKKNPKELNNIILVMNSKLVILY